jgi:hypothetical protein
VVWVYGVGGSGFAELIAHPKTRPIPIKLAMLVIVHPRSNLCVPVAQSMRVKGENLKVMIG